jgi:hypothetical protein
MFKKTKRFVFLMAIYLSGIVIGGVYTPEVITYAKQISAQENTVIPQKPQQIKKRFSKREQLG